MKEEERKMNRCISAGACVAGIVGAAIMSGFASTCNPPLDTNDRGLIAFLNVIMFGVGSIAAAIFVRLKPPPKQPPEIVHEVYVTPPRNRLLTALQWLWAALVTAAVAWMMRHR